MHTYTFRRYPSLRQLVTYAVQHGHIVRYQQRIDPPIAIRLQHHCIEKVTPPPSMLYVYRCVKMAIYSCFNVDLVERIADTRR